MVRRRRLLLLGRLAVVAVVVMGDGVAPLVDGRPGVRIVHHGWSLRRWLRCSPLSSAWRLLRPFYPSPRSLVSEGDGLRLPPRPPLRWRMIGLGDVERLGIHRIGPLLGRRMTSASRRMHHLMDLVLLLSQSLDVALNLVKAVVHGVDRFGIGVHVHGLDVGRLGLKGCLGLARRGSILLTQPTRLNSRQIFSQVL